MAAKKKSNAHVAKIERHLKKMSEHHKMASDALKSMAKNQKDDQKVGSVKKMKKTSKA